MKKKVIVSVGVYDFLRGAAAAVAALAVDPGDDRVRLGALLHARAQDMLHRLTETDRQFFSSRKTIEAELFRVYNIPQGISGCATARRGRRGPPSAAWWKGTGAGGGDRRRRTYPTASSRCAEGSTCIRWSSE